jgi:uncharacterized membrane protein required for colicin V production
MAYLLDGLLLAFLLYLVIIGLRDGFFEMLGRLLTTVLSLIVSLLLVGPVTRIISGIPFLVNLTLRMTDGILLPLRQALASIPSIVASFKLPPFLEKMMLTELTGTNGNGASRYDDLATMIAHFMLTALIFLLIFASAALLIRLFARFLTGLVNELPVLGLANRLFGMAAGLLYGLLILSVALFLLAMTAPYLPKVVQTVEETILLAYLYRQNLLLLIF